MTTINDLQPPSSGLQHIDALLDTGPGWNWLAPARTTLYYTFSLTDIGAEDRTLIGGALSAFNAAQQAATVSLLNYVASITGITFTATADGTAADLHFAAGNITDPAYTGYCSWNWSYHSSGTTVTSYTADAYIYLDNVEFSGITANPTLPGGGWEILLHEIGHALGLKHPFEGSVHLPAGEDNTAYTLMSYTHSGGPYGTYSAYDIAALMWLYGGDGLGGALGQGGALYLVGTSRGETLNGGTGNDVLEGGGGNDVLAGGAGTDTARFSGTRSQYTLTAQAGGWLVTGPDGTDTLSGIEFARFSDATVPLSPGNSAPSGSLTISGTAAQRSTLSVTSTLADADGMGPLAYRWQSSADGVAWSDVAGATTAAFTPGQDQVGLRLRVQVSWVDGGGTSESVASAATVPVANVNDAPLGGVTLSGNARSGYTVLAYAELLDDDGLGPLSYQWQSSADGSLWADVAGATATNLLGTDSLVGLRLRMKVSYTDGYGQLETVYSGASTAVLPANLPATGNVAVAGTLAQGQVLTVQSTLADPDGMGPLAYRWQASSDGSTWKDLAGATASSFTPAEAQVGLRLRVLVGFTDGLGHAEQSTSAATQPVANANDAPTGSLLLTGDAVQDLVLRATPAVADADGLGTLELSWQASRDGSTWQAIAGATGATFTLGSEQVGLQVRAVVRWVDGHDTTEQVASAATAPVAAAIVGTALGDQLTGTASADSINGLAGDDRLTGGGGNDRLVGGLGLDTAVYALARADYQVVPRGTTVSASRGNEGSDTLETIERLVFSDQALAFDLDGHAGTVARILGAVFGPSAVGNALYAGIGLKLLDGGTSLDALMQLALDTRLGAGFSPAAEVDLLYRNLLGQAPGTQDLAYWTGTLASGQYTAVSLAWMAANLDLNATNIALTGLVESGLPYLP